MNRLLLHNLETVDEIQEVDLSQSNINNFVFNYTPNYYRVSESDILRPDLISFNVYGVVSYWWLLMVVNRVFNPFRDLTVGALLKIPNILDIYDYYRKGKVRS